MRLSDELSKLPTSLRFLSESYKHSNSHSLESSLHIRMFVDKLFGRLIKGGLMDVLNQ